MNSTQATALTEDASLPRPFQRLSDIVLTRGLHRGTGYQDPVTWLLNWMNTPMDDLNGRRPVAFVDQPDWDLLLAGLLLLPTQQVAPNRPL